MTAELGIEVDTNERDERLRVVALSGSLDGNTAADLESAVSRLVDEGGSHLIFDLSRLGYVASAGIGVFINAQQLAQKNSGGIQLVRPSNAVSQVFKILGLQALFTIRPDVDAAIDAALT